MAMVIERIREVAREHNLYVNEEGGYLTVRRHMDGSGTVIDRPEDEASLREALAASDKALGHLETDRQAAPAAPGEASGRSGEGEGQPPIGQSHAQEVAQEPHPQQEPPRTAASDQPGHVKTAEELGPPPKQAAGTQSAKAAE